MLKILAATVPGTRHVMPGQSNWKNNQDAYFWVELPNQKGVVAVICDGCNNGEHSEVGANLAARKITEILVALLAKYEIAELPWSEVKSELIFFLKDIAMELDSNVYSTIENYFLFTIVGMIVTDDQVCIFNLGDGVCALDKNFLNFGPFPNNAPPYLMYNVTGSPVFDDCPELADFQVSLCSTKDVHTVLIGCDGVEDLIAAHDEQKFFPGTSVPVGPIERLFEADFFNNPDRLRRHLALMNVEKVKDGRITSGLLPDDTTMVMVRISREDEKLKTEENDHG